MAPRWIVRVTRGTCLCRRFLRLLCSAQVGPTIVKRTALTIGAYSCQHGYGNLASFAQARANYGVFANICKFWL